MSAALKTKVVEKVWGRTDIPQHFGQSPADQIGEVWFVFARQQQASLQAGADEMRGNLDWRGGLLAEQLSGMIAGRFFQLGNALPPSDPLFSCILGSRLRQPPTGEALRDNTHCLARRVAR